MEKNLENLDFLLNCNENLFERYKKKAFNIRINNFDYNIYFYAPSLYKYATEFFEISNKYNFIPISITGKKCELNCAHCKGEILKFMYSIEEPSNLFKFVKNMVENKKCTGVLISGGSNLDGMVPLENYIDEIKKIKDNLGINIVIHTGLVNEKMVKLLSKINIDAVMLDIIGDNETITKVYHLKKTVNDYELSLKYLNKYNVPFVPHIVIGLDYGQIKGELNALKMIRKYKPNALVFVIITPIENTQMTNIIPPEPKDISRILVIGRLLFPDIPLMLGCERPKGDHKVSTDILAIESGINGIAFPSEESIEYAIKQNFKLKFYETCCSLIYKDII